MLFIKLGKQGTSVSQFNHSVVSNSLKPHGLQHARLPCPSPTPRAYSNSCPLLRWCHPTISFFVILFSSCLQSFPASGLFQWVIPLHQVHTYKEETEFFKVEFWKFSFKVGLCQLCSHGVNMLIWWCHLLFPISQWLDLESWSESSLFSWEYFPGVAFCFSSLGNTWLGFLFCVIKSHQ